MTHLLHYAHYVSLGLICAGLGSICTGLYLNRRYLYALKVMQCTFNGAVQLAAEYAGAGGRIIQDEYEAKIKDLQAELTLQRTRTFNAEYAAKQLQEELDETKRRLENLRTALNLDKV